MTFSMTACGNSSENNNTEVKQEETSKDNVDDVQEETSQDDAGDVQEENEPSGIEDDGIGEVVSLTAEEKTYVLGQTTNTWLELSQEEKDELVVLIGRWWEACEGYIVEDYDDMVVVLDHQMEQYYSNNVDEGLMSTACDIYGLDVSKYVVD